MEVILSSLSPYLPNDVIYMIQDYYGHQLLWHLEVYGGVLAKPTRDTLSIVNSRGSGLMYHKVFFDLKEVPEGLNCSSIKKTKSIYNFQQVYDQSEGLIYDPNNTEDDITNLLKSSSKMIILDLCYDCGRPGCTCWKGRRG